MASPVKKHLGEGEWDTKHPFAWRTWLRGRLPWFLINLGVAEKGEDCDQVNAWHRWYNRDGENSACYHCDVERPGQLWRDDDATATSGNMRVANQ